MAISSLLLPSHGHAPYILGVRLLRNVATEICIPEYYGKKQRRILEEEFSNDADKIFLSEELGALLKPLLRDRFFLPSFNSYALSVSKNIERISVTLKEKYLAGIDAVSLKGIKRKFTEFDFALNTGLPIFSPIEPVLFAFVGKMSALYNLSPYQSPETQSLAKIWRQVEVSFERMFVPRLNSLSYLEYDETGITFTPTFAQPYPFDNSAIPQDATLVVASGTGLALEKLLVLADSSPGPCLTLTESPSIVDLPRVPSKSWGNPNVVAVLARSGLGSIWQALLNQKPIGVITPTREEDPEIFHNVKMVQETGIGAILDVKVDPLINALPQYLSEIQKQLEIEKKEFRTIDGIKYTSGKLQDMLLRELSNML